MAEVFHTTLRLKFRDADPAQIMYFGNLFSLAHDAFEEFIVAAGYAWKEWFSKGEYMIPIRHAESDFLSPFRPGETYDVAVTIAQMRETSFQVKYVFTKDGRTHGIVKMVHAVLSMATKEKTPLPTIMRERLGRYLETP